MDYQLYDVITKNATFTSNVDGTITATGVIAVTEVVGAYADKFLQTDMMPDIIIPSTETSATQPAYIEAQAVAFVATTYPNTP